MVTLRPAQREDLCTRRANVAWEGPDADCPTFKQTLAWAVRDEERGKAFQITEALQIFFGVCLTGLPLKNFVVLHGPGNTGKSTLVESFAWVLGSYATVAPAGLLTRSPRAQADHPTILTELEGRRFVYCAEPGPGEELNVNLIKQITGGERIKGRRMGENFYEFPLRCKLLIDTNHPLKFGDVSPALASRIILLPLRSEIPSEERRSLDDVRGSLRAEGSGILAWAVRGLEKYRAAGCPGDLGELLGLGVLQDRAEAVADQDVIEQWLEECVVEVDGDTGATHSDLTCSFENWCTVRGVRWSAQRFALEINERLRSGDRYGMRRRYEKVKVTDPDGARRVRWVGIVLK